MAWGFLAFRLVCLRLESPKPLTGGDTHPPWLGGLCIQAGPIPFRLAQDELFLGL